MISIDQKLLLDEIKKFENHFVDLEFKHLAAFSHVLRDWSDDYRQGVVAGLAANGLISSDNNRLRRVVC